MLLLSLILGVIWAYVSLETLYWFDSKVLGSFIASEPRWHLKRKPYNQVLTNLQFSTAIFPTFSSLYSLLKKKKWGKWLLRIEDLSKLDYMAYVLNVIGGIKPVQRFQRHIRPDHA
jgi:ABC-type transport system involved in cytochrome c biogenesis permease subunit